MWQPSIILGQVITYSSLDLFLVGLISGSTFLAGWLLHAYQTKAKPPQENLFRPEKALKKETVLLRDIINKSPDLIFIKNPQLQITFANTAFANILNKTPEELYGKTDSENGWSDEAVYGNPQKGIAGFEKDDKAVLSGEVIQNFNIRIMYNGKVRFLNTIKTPIQDETGTIVGILGMSRDITEQKRLEDIQIYSSQFQQLVTNLATEFINLRSFNFDIGVNHMLQQIGEFIGASRTYIYQFSDTVDTASMIYEWTSPSTKPQIDAQQNLSTKIFRITFDKFKRGEEEFIPSVVDLPPSRQIEKDRLLEQGIYARITLPLFQGDTLIGSMGFHATKIDSNWADYTVDLLKIVAEIYVNLLNRKQVGEKIRHHASLLANVTDAIISTDMNMIITSWNHGAERLYGYSEDEAIGKVFPELVRTDYSERHQDDIINEFFTKKQWKGELIRYHRDGTPIHVLVSASGVLDANGDMIGAVSVNHDISERKRSEKQQRELTLQNERIQLLEEVISDLSHDIKTPLTSIQLSLYMLKKQSDPEKQTEYLNRLEQHVKHLTKLVEDILTMTRLDKGAKLVFKPLDMNSMVEGITNTYQDVLEMKNKTMQVEFSPNLDPILASETELRRVFSNLIENAITYTPPGKAIIVRTYSDNLENIFEVEDSGIGIDEKDLPYIFNRFYRADKARDTSKGGTGLGLAIVKKLVELHGGIITVHSQIGEGSTFSVKLPVQE